MLTTSQIALCLAVVVLPIVTSSSSHDYILSSCKEIKERDAYAASGEYKIRTVSGKILDKVYCEMGLNDGGYTFIHPQDWSSLTNDEVQEIFTDKSNFLLRVRRANAYQPYGVLQQLPQYQSVQLKLGLNEHAGYNAPVNQPTLGTPYLYYGFLPITSAQNHNIQGVRVNGANVTFENCDTNPNSQLTLFANNAERVPTTAQFDQVYPFCAKLFTILLRNPSHRVMPADYFTFMETHWGGCGCFSQTDGRASNMGTISSAIGFR